MYSQKRRRHRKDRGSASFKYRGSSSERLRLILFESYKYTVSHDGCEPPCGVHGDLGTLRVQLVAKAFHVILPRPRGTCTGAPGHLSILHIQDIPLSRYIPKHLGSNFARYFRQLMNEDAARFIRISDMEIAQFNCHADRPSQCQKRRCNIMGITVCIWNRLGHFSCGGTRYHCFQKAHLNPSGVHFWMRHH